MSTGSKWRNDPRGPYIRMRSGEKVYLTDPSPKQIRIPDAAYHLARIHRYTGATEICVAQHMAVGAILAERFYPKAKLLPAQMVIHDVAEHLLGDVSAPLKSVLPEYKALEAKWDLAVESRFDTPFVGNLLVREVDDRLWLTERYMVYGRAMANGVDISEDYSGELEPFELSGSEFLELFTPWNAEYAEQAWMTELYERLPWIR